MNRREIVAYSLGVFVGGIVGGLSVYNVRWPVTVAIIVVAAVLVTWGFWSQRHRKEQRDRSRDL